MTGREDVCVLIPTLNEAETIGEVIDGFNEQGLSNVLVADGDSEDGTPRVAADGGARVFTQTGDGKGQAVREALSEIESDVILMVDGDGTYRPEDAEAMLEPILSGEAEHVIGDRFANMADGAMTRVNRTGNRLINRTFGVVHGRRFGDILSGYRAFTRESVERMRLSSDGFGVETEMAVECVRRDIPTEVVPISYDPRPDESETNLSPLRDGGLILYTLYSLARTHNPLFYFGSAGLASIFSGGGMASYVGYRWFAYGISHEVLAVVAAFGIIVGVQLIMFGVLSDLIVTLHREQLRRIDDLRDR